MAPRRAAAYIGGASVLVAWLASAGGVVIGTPPVSEQPRAVQTSGTTTLASEVQAQASRLRARMASPPAPQEPLRNPFAFGEREVRRERGTSGSTAHAVPRVPAPPAEPPLSLVGVAESLTPAGAVRTAMLMSESDEVYMLRVGDVLGARYRVKAIGTDAIELTDLVTGAGRRVALR